MRGVVLVILLLAGASAAVAEPVAGGPARPDAKAPAPARRAAPAPNDRATRLMIANFMEGHWLFRTIIDSGAPKLEAAEIVGPTTVPSASGKEVIYCASARVVLSRRKAFVRLVQQPDGKVTVHTRVVIDQGPCGDNAKPFPELERVRAARRKALGKSDDEADRIMNRVN